MHCDEDVEFVLQLLDRLRRGPGLAGHHSHTGAYLRARVVQTGSRALAGEYFAAAFALKPRCWSGPALGGIGAAPAEEPEVLAGAKLALWVRAIFRVGVHGGILANFSRPV